MFIIKIQFDCLAVILCKFIVWLDSQGTYAHEMVKKFSKNTPQSHVDRLFIDHISRNKGAELPYYKDRTRSRISHGIIGHRIRGLQHNNSLSTYIKHFLSIATGEGLLKLICNIAQLHHVPTVLYPLIFTCSCKIFQGKIF